MLPRIPALRACIRAAQSDFLSPATVEQRQEKRQADQDVIPPWVKKNGAAREDGAADPGKVTRNQQVARIERSAMRENNISPDSGAARLHPGYVLL